MQVLLTFLKFWNSSSFFSLIAKMGEISVIRERLVVGDGGWTEGWECRVSGEGAWC